MPHSQGKLEFDHAAPGLSRILSEQLLHVNCNATKIRYIVIACFKIFEEGDENPPLPF